MRYHALANQHATRSEPCLTRGLIITVRFDCWDGATTAGCLF